MIFDRKNQQNFEGKKTEFFENIHTSHDLRAVTIFRFSELRLGLGWG